MVGLGLGFGASIYSLLPALETCGSAAVCRLLVHDLFVNGCSCMPRSASCLEFRKHYTVIRSELVHPTRRQRSRVLEFVLPRSQWNRHFRCQSEHVHPRTVQTSSSSSSSFSICGLPSWTLQRHNSNIAFKLLHSDIASPPCRRSPLSQSASSPHWDAVWPRTVPALRQRGFRERKATDGYLPAVTGKR